jgi:hypothetical protein
MIEGVLCLTFAACTFLADTADTATDPAIGIMILGIIMIVISRKR